jgi:hypothetical protein
MSSDNSPPISVSGLRAVDYTSDGKGIIVTLVTKYSTAERKYSVPIECLQDLIVDLRRLNATRRARSVDTAIQSFDATGS